MRHFAGVIVQNPIGQVLAIRLKDKVPCWRIPGGKIESGESPREAAIRELKEEVGVEYVVLSYIGHNFCHADGADWTGYIFYCPVWKNVPVIAEPDKIEEMRWMEPAELSRLNPILGPDLRFVEGRRRVREVYSGDRTV